MLVLTEHHLYILQTLLKKSNIIDATDSLYLKTCIWMDIFICRREEDVDIFSFPPCVYL